MPRIWILLAAVLGASGVTIGAYHAHGLEKSLVKQFSAEDVEKKMDNCETAVRYQMYHVAALLAVGILSFFRRSKLIHAAGLFFILGVVGFSGGLYLMVFANNMIHWAIVPFGGLMLILGWIVFGVAGLFLTTSQTESAAK